LFYLLLYGILDNEKLSQRTLEDTFNDSLFKILFNLDKDERYEEVPFRKGYPKLIRIFLSKSMNASMSSLPNCTV
jgi:hypothetical protein